MAEALIKEVRHELAALLAADVELSQTLEVHVYDSRQLPGKFNHELCVFSGGAAPNSFAVLGKDTGGPVYQYIVLWLIKFESVDLSEAEDISDDVEQCIYRILLKENYSHAMWRKMRFPSLSIRPIAPGGTQNAHFGRVVVRIKV